MSDEEALIRGFVRKICGRRARYLRKKGIGVWWSVELQTFLRWNTLKQGQPS